MMCRLGDGYSLVPRASITANAVEGLVKLLRRVTTGGRLEAWLITSCTGSATPPNVQTSTGHSTYEFYQAFHCVSCD